MTENLYYRILVWGADAKTYLQGQLTCDMESLRRNRPLLACLNSPQGRVQAIVHVNERDAGIELHVIAPMLQKTIERLRKYVLRAKVTIEGERSGDSEPSHKTLLDNLRAGIPHIFPQTYESFVAQMLNLDTLGAISFEKGCYTGQEIIARAHFRGQVKRRMFRFAAEGAPPAPGAKVLVGAEHAGDVVYAAATGSSCELLAVVSLAQREAKLTLEGSIPLVALPLP